MNFMTEKYRYLQEENKQYYYYCFDDRALGTHDSSIYGHEVQGIRLPVYLSNIFTYSVSLPSASYSLDKYFNFIDVFG